VFAPDDQNATASANGIVRFNTSDGTALHFAAGVAVLDLNVGVNGKLYVLTPPTVQVYDPLTLQLEREVQLPLDARLRARGIAADRLGRVFLCGESGVWRLNDDGTADVDLYFGPRIFTDIEIDETDHVIVASDDGSVLLGLTSLEGFLGIAAAFEPGVTRHWPIFVAFGHAIKTVAPTPSPAPSPLTHPTITVSGNSTVVEGSSTQILFFSSTNQPVPITVHYSIGGNATQGSDYTIDGNPGVVTIPANSSSGSITLHALTDAFLRERNEKVTLTLEPGTDYALPGSRSAKKATITILNAGGRKRGQ
jgi:hypothetical protein